MRPFDSYPGGGRQLLGIRRGANARHEYGLRLQRLTGQTTCAYCGVDLIGDYYRWLLLQVDHVVPVREAIRIGIPLCYYEDSINLVLACSGCNGFDNRHTTAHLPQPSWILDDFIALRDEMFARREQRIADCRAREIAFFEQRPWRTVCTT